MKEATGELNMTVVTVLILAALGIIGVTVILPAIQTGIRSSSCQSLMNDEDATVRRDGENYWCCPSGTAGLDRNVCQQMDNEAVED